jgi:hypothetical protein
MQAGLKGIRNNGSGFDFDLCSGLSYAVDVD